MADPIAPQTRDAKASAFSVPASRWSAAAASGMTPEQLLLYRSNLLGADLTVTNFGGGNTSAKLRAIDPLTRVDSEVLWVKGSGGDLGSMALDGFATLYMDRFRAIEKLYRGAAFEDEMVGLLPHCIFGLAARAASIDTPLHGLLPFAHIDHVHPDALIGLAASSGGKSTAQAIWGNAIGWLDWRRPGFELGVLLRDYVAANPGLRGVILAGHGLICWAETSRDCYENTVAIIADAVRYLNAQRGEVPVFSGQIHPPLLPARRAAVAATLMPRLRGLMGASGFKVGHFSDTPEILEFVGSRDLGRLAEIGTSCPDHFLRTKISPLVVEPGLVDDPAGLDAAISDYRAGYAAYYDRCATALDPPMRDANPVVILVPGVGCITFAANKTTARLASEFYTNAINVMRGAEAIGTYSGLPETEAFAIEYWALEEAKLQRLPKPKPLAGRIALITGGAGGIGAASAERLLRDGACVVLVDLAEDILASQQQTLAREYGDDLVRSIVCDVTEEAQVAAAFAFAAREYGGIDILVANAGIASSAPIEETSIALWRKNYDVLAEGYFLTARAAFGLMRMHHGGSIVFIGSKNGLAATTNASAYASAKAASLHLARCLALEGAGSGIRVNTVNPDAVIRGSRIWDSEWRQERAGAHGVDPGLALEEHYRQRSMLGRVVLPEDVAEAVAFFASEASSKSTGNIINVDAGNAQAFPR